MNARELLALIDDCGMIELINRSGRDNGGWIQETILRALRLLAAAEANDGTTPVCDALREDLRYQEGCDWLKGFTELAERLDALEECLREMLDALRNDADYARFDAALEKARALLEGK